MQIPFYVPDLDTNRILETLREALENRWLTTGPLVRRFEEKLGEYLQTESIIAVASATAGLEIAMRLCGAGPGKNIIIPVNTFISTWETVVHTGATPRLADIHPQQWTIDTAMAEQLIDENTVAIAAVNFAGLDANLPVLRGLCDRKGIALIYDAAHGLESCIYTVPGHNYADITVYSFYATKNLTTAEGGAIVCRDDALKSAARSLSLHGMTRDAWNRYSGGSYRYDITGLGLKANMSDLHAAVGLSQIEGIESGRSRREYLAAEYRSRLDGLMTFQQIPDGYKHAWHLLPVLLNNDTSVSRDDLYQKLKDRGVGCSVHFIPVHQMSYVRDMSGNIGDAGEFRHCDDYFRRTISLPLYPGLNYDSLHYVCDQIHSILQN